MRHRASDDHHGDGMPAAGVVLHMVDEDRGGLPRCEDGRRAAVSEEEVKVLLQQGARLGTFDKEEPEIIDNVFELNDRTASDCMTARPLLDWLDLEDEEKKIWADMMETSHFRLPVGKGSLDDFKGLADVSEILIDQHKHPGSL